MDSQNLAQPNRWHEQDSETFIEYGRYFVPERERQVKTITNLVPRRDQPGIVLELGCGQGLLAQSILQNCPAYTVVGLDGSPEMRRQAQERLSPFGQRFQAKPFDLAQTAWRNPDSAVHAVVSSLVIHHLDGPQKQSLFGDVFHMLVPGGAFIIADLVKPAHELGRQLAAQAWDEAVRQRALQLDGNVEGFAIFERNRWNMYRYFDPEDVDKPSPLFDQLRWLQQAGFTHIDVYWMHAGHAIFGGLKPAQ